MLRLCDIEGRALAMGYTVERFSHAVSVCRVGGSVYSGARWEVIDGGKIRLDYTGDFTDVEIEYLETGMSPGRALIVTAVALLRVGTGGGRAEAIRQGERLADELDARGYLEALAALAQVEVDGETPAPAAAHDIDF